MFPRWHFALALTYCVIFFPIFEVLKLRFDHTELLHNTSTSLISDRDSCSEAKVIEIELRINRWSVINAYPTAVRWRARGEKEVGIALSRHKRHSTLHYGQKKYKDAYYEYMIPIPRRFIENKLQYSPGTHKNTYGFLRAVLEDFDHLEPSNRSNLPIVGHFGTGQFSTGQFGTGKFCTKS